MFLIIGLPKYVGDKKVMELSNVKDIGEFFDLCGKRFNQAAASTIGTLVSSALFMLGIKFRRKTELTEAEVVLIPSYMSDAISINGHAKLGDKTILDSLIPFSVSFQKEYEKTGDILSASQEAARIAKESAKATRGMIATIGRAKWIGERSRDYPDPDAVLCSVIVDSIVCPEETMGYRLPEYEN